MRIKIDLYSSPSPSNSLQPKSKTRNDIKTVSLTIYRDLLGQHEIIVQWNAKGLVARVRDLKTGAEVDNLPLTGIPSQLLQVSNLHRIKAFVQHSHLIPERGVDGCYNRVSVHVTARGGNGEGKIPFQPGLALGSVVNGQTLEQLERYAEIVAEKQNLEDQIRLAEEKIEALLIKKEARKAQKPPPSAENEKSLAGKTTDILIKIWDAEIEKLNAFIITLGEKLGTMNEQLPVFSNFQTETASPVNMGVSKIENRPDGFESIHYAEQYVRMAESNAEIHNKVTQSSSGVTISADAGYHMLKAGFKFARAAAIAKTLLQIKKEGKAEGVLVINAIATLKHVRRITEVKYDIDRLKRVFQTMKTGSADELKAHGISSAPNKEKAIYILTEEVMGAAFTALITFQDETHLKRDAAIEQKESNTQLSAHLEGGDVQFKGAVEGSISLSSASKNEQDLLRSKGLTRINIDIHTQGALPRFERNILEHEVMSHLQMDPAKVEFSKTDEADAVKIATSVGIDKQVAIEKQRLKMEYAGIIALNSLRGLKSSTETQEIHSLESVMAAYENFIEQITKDPHCGVPIGFNYDILKESEIEHILKQMELKPSNPGSSPQV